MHVVDWKFHPALKTNVNELHQDLRLIARQGTLQNELEFIVNFLAF